MNNVLNIVPVKVYEDIYNNRIIIYKDNRNKAGIYRLTNKTNGKSYIGSSIDLSNRFRAYFSINNLSRIIKNEKSLIYSAIIKYGYTSFILEILEYCDQDKVIEREQYFIDSFNPEYNILKIASTRLGYTPTLETRILHSIVQRKKYSNKQRKIHQNSTTKTTTKIVNNSSVNRPTSNKTREILSLRSRGVTVKIFDKSGNFLEKFNTMKDAAKHLNLSVVTIKSIFDRGFSYDNYIYEFEARDNRI